MRASTLITLIGALRTTPRQASRTQLSECPWSMPMLHAPCSMLHAPMYPRAKSRDSHDNALIVHPGERTCSAHTGRAAPADPAAGRCRAGARGAAPYIFTAAPLGHSPYLAGAYLCRRRRTTANARTPVHVYTITEFVFESKRINKVGYEVSQVMPEIKRARRQPKSRRVKKLPSFVVVNY